MKHLLAVLFAVPLLAQDPANFKEIKTQLGLTDTQVKQLTDIHDKRMEAEQGLVEQMFEKDRALEALVNADNLDAAAATQLILEKQSLRKQISALGEQHLKQARAVLNETQLLKLKALEDVSKLQGTLMQASALNLIAPPHTAFGATFAMRTAFAGGDVLEAPVPAGMVHAVPGVRVMMDRPEIRSK